MEPAVTIIDWDGEQVPDELHKLPPGRYVVEAVLGEEEEAGILAGLDELDAGHGIPLVDVIREIRSRPRP